MSAEARPPEGLGEYSSDGFADRSSLGGDDEGGNASASSSDREMIPPLAPEAGYLPDQDPMSDGAWTAGDGTDDGEDAKPDVGALLKAAQAHMEASLKKKEHKHKKKEHKKHKKHKEHKHRRSKRKSKDGNERPMLPPDA